MKQEKQVTSSHSKVYVFVGEGLGVPGIPHEINLEDAQQLGIVDLLHDAIANGNYQLKQEV